MSTPARGIGVEIVETEEDRPRSAGKTSKVSSSDFSIGTGIGRGWCELATDTQQRFVERALRRKKLFLALSIVGIVIAVVLAAYSGVRRLNDPTFPIGPRAVIVVLILLNSRQNLRQYRFASFIEDLRRRGLPP